MDIDKKIEKLKQTIKEHTLKKVLLDNGVIPDYKLEEYKNKKAKARKKTKLQKKSRKANR